ncbi:MAG: hypothetical protein VW438_06645, partial [Euryarchaeota archaeon]
ILQLAETLDVAVDGATSPRKLMDTISDSFTFVDNVSDADLAAAYRLRMGLPESMSDDEVIKRFQNQGVPKNKKGAAKLPKKSIMELPTNVPRLKQGALLGDLNKDGKMSGYETARQKAITKSMKEQKSKK